MANDLTVAQLERLLDQKKTLLNGLQKRREKLQAELNGVEKRISTVGGAKGEKTGRKSSRRGHKRPRNDKTLLEVITEVLGQNKKGLLLGDLSDKVLATGYKTGSVKFSNTVYQCLYNNSKQIVCDPSTRLYRLK